MHIEHKVTVEEEQIAQLNNDGIKTPGDLQRFLERTNKAKPAPEDMKLLRQALDTIPALTKQFGDLGRNILRGLIHDAYSNSRLNYDATVRYIDEMRESLGYSSATFLEQMLIDEVCGRWFRLHLIQFRQIQTTNQSHTFRVGVYWERRLEKAQTGYLRAVETLAKVRKHLAEGDYHEQRARNARSAATLKATQIYRAMSD